MANLMGVVAERVTFARRVSRSGTNYTTNIVWLMRRNLAGCGRKLVAVFGFGQISLAAQGAAIFTLYWYAQRAQSNAIVSIGPFEMGSRAPAMLWTVVILSAICFLVSSGFLYLSRSMVLAVGEDNIGRGLTEIVGIARRLPDPRAPEASRIAVEVGLKKVNRGCRLGAMATVILINAVTPLVGGIVAGGALLVIEPGLTLIIAVGAVVWSTFLYPLTIRQVQFASRRGREDTAFKEESQALLKSPSLGMPEKMNSAVRLAEVFLGRRRVVVEMAFLLEIGGTIIGAAAAFYMASKIMAGGAEWPIFIVYVGGLRVALAGYFAGPRTFGVVSRFYPQLIVFIQFAQSAARIDRRDLGAAADGAAIVLGTLPNGAAVTARGGDRIALATSAKPEAVQVAFLEARDSETERPLATTWVQSADASESRSIDPPIRFVEFAMLAGMDRSVALEFLEGMGDGVTLIAYRDESQVGAFGERTLMTINSETPTASVPLGTLESAAALETFVEHRERALKAEAARQAATDIQGDDEDEEV